MSAARGGNRVIALASTLRNAERANRPHQESVDTQRIRPDDAEFDERSTNPRRMCAAGELRSNGTAVAAIGRGGNVCSGG